MPDAPSPQHSLWRPEDFHPSVAETSLIHFARKYLEGLAAHTDGGPLPRWMDEHSFACILICQEHGDKLSHNAVMTLGHCRRAAAERGGTEWLDATPWDIAIAVLDSDAGGPLRHIPSQQENIERFGILIANLTHHNSGIRNFMFESAWFVRNRLRNRTTVEGLLKNVADTLGGWDVSLGLCSSLFDEAESFWRHADEYQPEERFAAQYRDRLQTVRDVGLGICQCSLYALDSKIRSLIDSFAYGLRCNGD